MRPVLTRAFREGFAEGCARCAPLATTAALALFVSTGLPAFLGYALAGAAGTVLAGRGSCRGVVLPAPAQDVAA